VRLVVATVQVPFMRGGAESLAEGLVDQLRRRGHETELVSMPFRFAPASAVRHAMDAWAGEDFARLNGCEPDRVICLKFPAYYLAHHDKRVWLIHQHRAAYELWDTPHDGGLSQTREGKALQEAIEKADRRALGACGALYTISERVSERLLRHNGLASTPIYHPPALASRLYTAASEPYVFFPSRLEGPKRQALLIEALAHVKTPAVALLAGEGGLRAALEQQIERLGLTQRVRLLGRVTDAEMLAYFAHCTAAFFGPFDEDYGLVALEAMLAGKPLVTCTDSGEPARFVVDGETGLVVEPEPEAVAAAIDSLCANPRRAAAMGRAALERYRSLDISWERVVDLLLRD
jgi:glycosyltransferase involved in cell wall biosynthesis